MRRIWRSIVLLVVIAGGVLLFYGIRSNLRGDWFLAAVQSRDVEAVKRLLERQPDLLSTRVMPQGSDSRRDGRIRWQGRMPVHTVATDIFSEAIPLAEAMFAAGADFTDRLDGDTPLHLAAATGRLAMVALLLDKGADVNVRNGCEHPAEAICNSGQYADWQPFDRERSGGIVCTGCEHDGRTPLHAAQPSLHAFDVSTLLLSRGANVHATDALGRTPLHSSAHVGPAGQNSRVLCAYGADPSVRDRQGKLPIDLARETRAERDPTGAEGVSIDWFAPGGGCAQLAARAKTGAPVPAEEMDAAWREFFCGQDARRCGG